MSARVAKRDVTRGLVGRARRAARLLVLMEQMARGHSAALADLYDETCESVYGVALSIAGSPQLAGELTIEVYAEAWRQAGRYDPGTGPVLTWLLTLAHRHLADRVRGMSAGPRPEAPAVPPRHEARPDVDLARQALDSLRPADREAVALVYFGGHTESEAAGILGLPVSTVRTSLRDGLVTLRTALGVGA